MGVLPAVLRRQGGEGRPADRTVVSDTVVLCKKVQFDSPNSYNLAGLGGLTLEADFTGNATVDLFDLAELANNYGWSEGGGSPVPEPMTAGLLLAGGLGVLLRRRRR